MMRSAHASSLCPWLAGLLALIAALPALSESTDPNAELDAVQPPATDEQSERPEEDAESEAPDAPATDDAADAPTRRPGGSIETANLEDPVFPELRVRDAFRVRFQSRFMPSGNFDSFDADLYKPQVRFRATAPVRKWAAIQLTTALGTSRYTFDDVDLLGSPRRDALSDFYEGTIRLQGAARLNETRSFFVEDEIWSALVAGEARARWEPGAFSDAITGGGVVAFGYEIEGLIRVAVGVAVGSRLGRSGVGVSPIANFKWNATDRFTVRSRGRGLQLEYAFNPKFEVFATSFLDGDRFLLDNRPGLPSDTVFRDKSVLAGAGFEWKINKHFRINVEAGAVAWREMRVRSQRLGTLFKERAEPGAYFDVRFEARP